MVSNKLVHEDKAVKEQQDNTFKAYHKLMDTEKRSVFCLKEAGLYLFVLDLYLASSVINSFLKILGWTWTLIVFSEPQKPWQDVSHRHCPVPYSLVLDGTAR